MYLIVKSPWMDSQLKSWSSVQPMLKVLREFDLTTESISNLAKSQQDHGCTFALYSLNVIMFSCHSMLIKQKRRHETLVEGSRSLPWWQSLQWTWTKSHFSVTFLSRWQERSAFSFPASFFLSFLCIHACENEAHHFYFIYIYNWQVSVSIGIKSS